MTLPTKPCAVCGRVITWRKKWERAWPQVKFCSERCRRRRHDSKAPTVEQAILSLLEERPRDATVCPSEIARLLAPEDWRPLMEPVREAARRLVAAGQLDITQRGAVVDASTARGAIRLRLRRHA